MNRIGPWVALALVAACTTIAAESKTVPMSVSYDSAAEAKIQFNVLVADLQNRNRFRQFAAQTFHPAASITDTDRDPLDVILRRTRTLLEDIQAMPDAPGLGAQKRQLDALETNAAEVDVADSAKRFELFKQVHVLRRRIAFANPLLNFDKLLFIKRERARFNHMCDQYYGVHAVPGGGLFVLSDPFGDEPELKDVLENATVERGRLKGEQLNTGGFLSPELSYDGKTIYFATSSAKESGTTSTTSTTPIAAIGNGGAAIICSG